MTPRLLFLVLLVGVAAIGVRTAWEDRAADGAATGPAVPSRAVAGSVASPASDEVAPTWYCAAGTAGGLADHTVIVANPATEAARVGITVFPDEGSTSGSSGGREPHRRSAGEADRGSISEPYLVTVPPQRERTVRLADLAPAMPAETFLSALVEMEGTDGVGRPLAGMEETGAVEAGVEETGADGAEERGVQVRHEVSGTHGAAAGPCSPRAASQWHFAWGATTRDARDLLVLFNPFPNDAVVDAVFSTPDGLREPVRWQGLTVPGRRVVAVDVGGDVTRRSHVAASLHTRTGSLVVERLQAFDGSLDIAEGVRLALGHPAPSEVATFLGPRAGALGNPDSGDSPGGGGGPEGSENSGGSGGEARERIVVYNPTNDVAEVDVVARPDDPEEPEPLPFRLVLRPWQFEALDYAQEARVRRGGSHTTFVRSTNGVPVVAEQVLLGNP